MGESFSPFTALLFLVVSHPSGGFWWVLLVLTVIVTIHRHNLHNFNCSFVYSNCQ